MRLQIRHAVTLIEVIFSIGVVLIGLLGLLSIMPLAGRRSQEAVSLANAAAMGDTVMNELLSRRLLTSGLLTNLNATEQTVTYNSSVNSAVSPSLPRLQLAGTSFVGGVCIDPIYKGKNQPSVSPGNHFNDSLFPYFVANHDPLTDPSDTASVFWPAAQARLNRVGFATTAASTAAQRLEQSRTLVESTDDLNYTRAKDRSIDASLDGLAVGTMAYGRRVPSGEFSWIATISPMPGNRFASISVVVIRKRAAERDFPTSTTIAANAAANGVSERMAYVTSEAGFSGGAGGSVRLAASDKTLGRLRSNDWIMLSRVVEPGTPREVHVHRWYRVAAIEPMVNGKPRIVQVKGSPTTVDPVLGCYLPSTYPTTTQSWVREAILDGPDWEFGLDNDASGVFNDNTFATIVSDVVSVTERIVRLSDL